jgi:hypothetical protein
MLSFKGKKVLKFFLIAIIIAATIPSAYKSLSSSFDFRQPRESLSSPFQRAMRFLAGRGEYDHTVLEIPSSDYGATDSDLKRWFGTSRLDIVAFANKRSFLAHEYADYYGTDEKPRMLLLQKILKFNMLNRTHPEYEILKKEVENELINNNIVYIYSPQPLHSMEMHNLIDTIYYSENITIYEVKIN